MNTAVMQRDNLMPKAPGGIGKGFALATIVHIGLVVALAFGVSWRVSEPEGVEAELWAAVPNRSHPNRHHPSRNPSPSPRRRPR